MRSGEVTPRKDLQLTPSGVKDPWGCTVQLRGGQLFRTAHLANGAKCTMSISEEYLTTECFNWYVENALRLRAVLVN